MNEVAKARTACWARMKPRNRDGEKKKKEREIDERQKEIERNNNIETR